MERDSLKMLDLLIKEISQIYKNISHKWSKDKGYIKIILRKVVLRRYKQKNHCAI